MGCNCVKTAPSGRRLQLQLTADKKRFFFFFSVKNKIQLSIFTQRLKITTKQVKGKSDGIGRIKWKIQG